MKFLHHLAHVQSLSFPLRYESGTKIDAKTVTIDWYREWPQKRKALGVSALTIECEICCVLLIGNHFPTQKWEKMLPKTSWGVIAPPVISER